MVSITHDTQRWIYSDKNKNKNEHFSAVFPSSVHFSTGLLQLQTDSQADFFPQHMNEWISQHATRAHWLVLTEGHTKGLPSTTSVRRNTHSKEFPRNYSSCLSRTWLLPVTYSDCGPCDAHEIWHVRNNWNQAKACRAIARRRSNGHGGADIFRAAVRLRPQEGRLEGNKPFKPRGR